MRILMLNPPFMGKFSREQRSPAVTKSGTFYYPMWLAYATGVLEREGFEVRLVDAPAKDLRAEEMREFIQSFSPSLVVVDTSTPSIYNDVKVAEDIKGIVPDSVVVLVGPHVSATPSETLSLSDNVDVVCRGEYDYAVRDIARAMERGRGFNHITGISYRRGGEIVHNGGRAWVDNLDELPWVSRTYKKHLDYTKYFYAHSKCPIVTILGGRGCPHQCVYCVYPQAFSGRKVRFRAVGDICDELQFILKEFPSVREIMFEDDTLTVNKKRCREFSEEILKRDLKLSWSANSRADVDLETLELMKRAGCRLLCVGIESGVQEILDRMKKRLKVETIRAFTLDAKRAGILVHGCFLAGTPGETKETLEATLRFAKELNPDTAQFFPLMVYPGTEAYEWAKERGYLTTEDFSKWLTEDGLHNCVVSQPGLSSQELREFCDRARWEFYTRPKYLLGKLLQAVRKPEERGRLMKSGRNFARHLVKGARAGSAGRHKTCA